MLFHLSLVNSMSRFCLHALLKDMLHILDTVVSITSKMSLQLCSGFKVTFSVFVLLVPMVFPLKISQDTLKEIKLKKFYPYGAAFPSDMSHLSLANPTGAIALARLEFEIHSIILKKISSRSQSDETNFTRALLEYEEDYRATASSLIQSGMETKNSVKPVAENMIAVYRMVRRFRNYIQPWIFEQKKSKALPFQTEVLDAINPTGKTLGLLTNDFHLSMLPIITTQFIMDWYAEDICSGAVEGMELGATLKAVHCLEIGVHAVASGIYPIGIEWMEQAFYKVTQENDTSVNLPLAMDVLEEAYAKHDERWRPKNLAHLEETFYVTRLNESVNGQDGKLSRKWQKQREYKLRDAEVEAQDLEAFSKTCQGKVEQPESIKSKLFCWLETSVHPTWKLGPLKAELLSAFPDDIVLFHDVISKSLTEEVIEFGESIRRPGLLYKSIATPKTCLSFGFQLKDPSLAGRLDGLTERVTGLQTKQAMPNSVTSYPPGGHLNLHTDFMGSDEYITTVIYYLTAPEIGGGTAITHAQVNLKPPAGSAVLWYFTYKSGALRKGRAHGACPLVKGQKWITAQGLQYLKQTQLVCDTDEYARMEYLVNGRSKYTGGGGSLIS